MYSLSYAIRAWHITFDVFFRTVMTPVCGTDQQFLFFCSMITIIKCNAFGLSRYNVHGKIKAVLYQQFHFILTLLFSIELNPLIGFFSVNLTDLFGLFLCLEEVYMEIDKPAVGPSECAFNLKLKSHSTIYLAFSTGIAHVSITDINFYIHIKVRMLNSVIRSCKTIIKREKKQGRTLNLLADRVFDRGVETNHLNACQHELGTRPLSVRPLRYKWSVTRCIKVWSSHFYVGSGNSHFMLTCIFVNTVFVTQ